MARFVGGGTFDSEEMVLCPFTDLLFVLREADPQKDRVPSGQEQEFHHRRSAMAKLAGGGTLVPDHLVLFPFGDLPFVLEREDP